MDTGCQFIRKVCGDERTKRNSGRGEGGKRVWEKKMGESGERKRRGGGEGEWEERWGRAGREKRRRRSGVGREMEESGERKKEKEKWSGKRDGGERG